MAENEELETLIGEVNDQTENLTEQTETDVLRELVQALERLEGQLTQWSVLQNQIQQGVMQQVETQNSTLAGLEQRLTALETSLPNAPEEENDSANVMQVEAQPISTFNPSRKRVLLAKVAKKK